MRIVGLARLSAYPRAFLIRAGEDAHTDPNLSTRSNRSEEKGSCPVGLGYWRWARGSFAALVIEQGGQR
jgi:hypothetical protein